MDNPDLYLLEADRPIMLEAARARLLRVVSGTVWITASGIPEDVFLQAGAVYQIPLNGRILIDALHGKAQVQVQPVSGFWARLLDRLVQPLPRGSATRSGQRVTSRSSLPQGQSG